MSQYSVLKVVRSVGSIVVLMLVLAAIASAQGMRRMSPEDRAAMLKDSLALDSAQTAKVVKIYKDAQVQMQDAFQSNQGDREAIRAAMQEIGKKTDESIKAVLTDAQKAKYEQMLKNRPMRGMRGRRN